MTEDNKPVLDEQTFEKLLEAGYVLQEHGRKMRELEARMESHSERLRQQESANQAPLPIRKPASEETSRSDRDYTLTLAEIVEAQRQIQVRHLDLDKAMAVIAEKVARIAGATGAGIGILNEKMVRYRGGAGAPALPLGTEVPLSTAVCAASVRTGQVIRSEDVNTELLFDPEPCRERGILSLVAVPIYHDGDIVGGLELYFDSVRGYAEQDIHTCQLMAGLVTEAIGRDADSKVKKSMAAERSTMLAAIEKLKPNLAALSEDQSAAAAKTSAWASAATAAKSPCWKCGNALLAEEQFCGTCGAPRDSNSEPSSMQSKLASAWLMQQSQQNSTAAPSNGATHPLDTPLPPDLDQPHPLSATSFAASADEDAMPAAPRPSESQFDYEETLGDHEGKIEADSTALVKPQQEDVVWSSAAKARNFLEKLAGTRTPNPVVRFWNSRRGDFYLAVAVILVVAVIRWGIWSNHAVGATSHGTAVSGSANPHKQPAPDADLSTFDKLLVSLGLAEAPEPPKYNGNPDTQVWIDLQTALYYCPGSDLYGKTPKGRVSSQRDAQLDQFEPADRKPCD
ncbi:MAG TPA: GAF domain-containing protein [Candidatus Dormibacteraeota bacterium]|nr:GAF domain-containing protein [Candidatus Dormibacteraeota bacterium]